ncbi:hypothetical protein GDO78_005196 [Eleutherodactylus coqui]|uniref:Secreted protein n=1 Tax=Eleutherodactylus coqui TaxID=57060 RepID=A0A8J6FJD4_ELECQ|nr:hypothetical protein GDO78_005196 [Eleutherodactylus coqui]
MAMVMCGDLGLRISLLPLLWSCTLPPPLVWRSSHMTVGHPLVVVRGTMTAQRCVQHLLQPHVFLSWRLPRGSRIMLGRTHKGVTGMSPQHCHTFVACLIYRQ